CQLFPLGKRRDSQPWKGARPCLPDMKPVIGPAPDKAGLWLAQIMDGEEPAVDMAPFRVDRF
ncbi:amino acid dehydrogenase, partial [Halomonas sp. BBD45]|nr:amino acid dehydrogenase [Halomonas sp. BBD45]